MGAVVGRYGHDGAAAPGEPVSVGQFVSLGLLTIKRQRQGNCNSGSLRDDNKNSRATATATARWLVGHPFVWLGKEEPLQQQISVIGAGGAHVLAGVLAKVELKR